MPHLIHETRLGGLVAGVDEVGRGPVAGPVFAAAVILHPNLQPGLKAAIDDSKKLSPATRIEVLHYLRVSGSEITLGAASVNEIARLNILQAAMLAMRRAIARLPSTPDHVLIDGNRAPGILIPCTTLIGGDAISLSIAAASIAAKVARDRLMSRLHIRYPDYAWDENAGYATAAHRAAILAAGATPHHRMSFGPLLRAIAAAPSFPRKRESSSFNAP